MKNLIYIKSLFLFILLCFSLNTFSQAKDVKKLHQLFEDKKWTEFEKKYSEIVEENGLAFDQIVKYDGVLDDVAFTSFSEKYYGYKFLIDKLKTDNLLSEKYQMILLLSYMRVHKIQELRDSSNYLSTLDLTRNAYFLTLIKVDKSTSSPFQETFLNLNISEANCFELLQKSDSLVVDLFYNNNDKSSKELSELGIRQKLNTSLYQTRIDKHIQTKEEDEAVASKDLKTLVEVIKKYPKSNRRPELLVHYDDFYFDYAKSQGTIETYKLYLTDLPNGKYINQVKTNLEDLHFGKAINSTDLKYIKQVIATYPTNEKVNQLQYHLEELEFANANKQGESGLKLFIQTYPKSAFAIKAQELLVESSIQQAITSNDILTLQSIILEYPNHSKINEMITLVKDAETRALKLSTYSGNYFDGKSTYEYYVNANGDRVLHGKFEFYDAFYGDYDQESLKLDFLAINNFPSVNNPSGADIELGRYSNMTSFIWFLGGTPRGKFTGSFKHGKKDGVWKYEYYNEHTYNLEVLTLTLKNDLLVSASYIVTNKKYKLPSSSCIPCEDIRLTILPTGFESEFYFANGSDYITGNYLNGQRNGTWRQYVKYFDPEGDPEEMNFDSETFPADITLNYSNGKLESKKIRNQETGQLYTPTE